MKSTLLRVALFTSLALALIQMCDSAVAQGTVNFSNNGYSLVRRPLWGDWGDPIPPNGGFVELLWAPAGTASQPFWGQSLTQWLTGNPGWMAIDSSITAIGPLPGRFLGGSVTIPTATPGRPIQARIAAWTGNYSSFDAAVFSGNSGAISEAFFIQTGNPTTTPPGVPALITGPNGFRGMPVPEPSVAGLILLALVLDGGRRLRA